MNKKFRSHLTSCMRTLLALAISGAIQPASGWIYPEHRDISILAVQALDPARRAAFDALWQEARAGDEQRLCAQGAESTQGLVPSCIDWAALAGIAGDHSCSSREMLETVRTSDWILLVADIGAQLKVELARIPVTASPGTTDGGSTLATEARRRFADAKDRADRLNALRVADTRLQRADPQYAFRADANLAHFLLPRPDTNLDIETYGELTVKAGSVLNAGGVYLWFHISALRKAGRLADERLAPEERRALARAALFDEAFGLHFLQDVFAAGHVAGSWGDVSQRKGTHDLYNQHGLEVWTWKGRETTKVLMGDAHMRPQDADFAARTARTSLEQVLDAATGRSRGYALPSADDAPGQPDAFDVCKTVTFPDRGFNLGTRGRSVYAPVISEVALETPVPGLGPGAGSLPRTRSEVGKFFGLAGSIDGRAIDGGFASGQNGNGLIGGLDVGFRVGLGLEGALGDSGDGLVFAQVGYRAEPNSTNRAEGTVLGDLSGSFGAAIPSRNGPSARIRMPFYLVPGDLLFLSPMYLVNPTAYREMAVTAAQGGLIPWQRPWSTSIGRFQFVLGREIGMALYGVVGDDQVAVPGETPGSAGRLVNYKSVFFDLPILEYRPFRSYSSNQSSTVLFQLFAGLDLPYDESVEAPQGAPSVDLDPVYSLGLRMSFDWRHYR